MSEQTPLPPVRAMAVPPIAPGALPERPTTWPMPIGIIAIVFGSLAFLAYGCGGVFQHVAQGLSMSVLKVAAQNPSVLDAQMDLQRKYLVFNLSSSIVLGLLGILLLVCGIGLIRRRPWVRTGILTWAIVRAVVAIPVAWISFIIAQESMRIMTESAAGDPSMAGNPGMGFANGIMKIFGPVGIVASVMWSWLLPVFMLVWFLLPRVRNEVRNWRSSRSV